MLKTEKNMKAKHFHSSALFIIFAILLFNTNINGQGKAGSFSSLEFPATPLVYDSVTSIYAADYQFRFIVNYSLTLLQDSRVKSNESYKATIFNSIGLNYWKLGELDSALHFLGKNIEIRERQNDTSALGKSYNNIGVLYWKKGNLEKAYFNFSKALVFREKKKDMMGMVLVLNNLGLIYQRLKYYSNAIEAITRALRIADSIDYKFGIGYSYRRIANLNLEKGDFNNFSLNADKALRIYKELNAEDDMAEVLNDYGRYYLLLKQYETAESYFRKSYDIAIKIKDKFVEANSLSYLGEASLLSGKYDAAKNYILKSLTLSIPRKFKVISSNNYHFLYKVYEKNKDIENALKCLKSYIALKDSLMDEAIISNIADEKIKQVVLQSEASKQLLIKENELNLRQIKVQQRLNMFFILFIAAISLALVAIVRLYLKQKKLQSSLIVTNKKLNSLNSELQENNRLLEEANNTKNKLFSIIAHDLKNPFLSIYGFAEMIFIKAQKSTESELKKYSEILLESSKKLVQLIDNLTKWAQLHQSSFKPSPEEFNLFNEVELIIKQLKLNLELKNISLSLEVDPSALIFADKEMMATVMRNIISNAIKFTPPEGKIFIRSEKDNRFFNIIIKDTGIGMGEELVKKIMDGKHITSSLGTSNEKGTGIGLSICREFILLNKGLFFINSEPDRGSEFKISIPQK